MCKLKRGPSFKDWKIRYLLDVAGTGRTIQTRRPLKTPETNHDGERLSNLDGWEVEGKSLNDTFCATFHIHNPDAEDGIGEFVCDVVAPYQKGTYLVREATEQCVAHATYTATGDVVKSDTDIGVKMWEKRNSEPYKRDQLPAMYMRSDWARLQICLAPIKVEKFGDISRADAIAEGVEWHPEWPDDPYFWCGYEDRPAAFFNEVVIPGIYDEIPAEWWWVYSGTVSLIGENHD